MTRIFVMIVGAILLVGIAFRLVLAAQGYTVTSWWRTPAHNAEVGGVPNSLHMLGLAYDVVPVTSENIAALQDLGFRVLIENDHLHLTIV